MRPQWAEFGTTRLRHVLYHSGWPVYVIENPLHSHLAGKMVVAAAAVASSSSSSSSAAKQDEQNEIVPLPHVDSVAFLCGLISGVTQAGLLNPYDRALYLSIKTKTPFLSKSNFQSPYQGFLQSVGGRALSSGL